MRRLVVLSLLLTAPWLAVVSTPAGAATDCQGQAATIVGVPGERLVGTSGVDVIVTNRARRVYAGAGDDVVCVTAMPYRTLLNAGTGDDSIVVDDGAYQRLRVELGPGSDRFVGGAGKDMVRTFDPADEPNRADDVSTGGGDDIVHATRPMGPATADADGIDLGRGRDILALGDSGLAAGASVKGGPGIDELVVHSYKRGTDVTIDTRARTIERGGPYLHDWDSFEDYFVQDVDAIVRFEGSSSSEQLEIGAARKFIARMRGGDDIVTMKSKTRADVSGGRGRDRVIVRHFVYPGGAWIDLRRGRIGTGTLSPRMRPYAEIAGVEDATAIGGSEPLVVGDNKSNSLVANCGTVRGGGGDDHIEENIPLSQRGRDPDACFDFVAYGGPGGDTLIGSAGPDVLLGGTGHDRAVGRRGRDQCVAEVEHSCER